MKLNLFIIGYDFSLWAFWNSSSHSRMCTSKISNELSKFLRKIFSNTKFFLQFWMCISKILNELSKFLRQIFSNFNSRMCISNMLNEQIFSSIFLILPPILEDFEWNIVKYFFDYFSHCRMCISKISNELSWRNIFSSSLFSSQLKLAQTSPLVTKEADPAVKFIWRLDA